MEHPRQGSSAVLVVPSQALPWGQVGVRFSLELKTKGLGLVEEEGGADDDVGLGLCHLSAQDLDKAVACAATTALPPFASCFLPPCRQASRSRSSLLSFFLPLLSFLSFRPSLSFHPCLPSFIPSFVAHRFSNPSSLPPFFTLGRPLFVPWALFWSACPSSCRAPTPPKN